MNKVILAVVLSLFLNLNNIFAQTKKFGHIDSQKLIALMPEKDSAEVKMKRFASELEEQLVSMNVELDNKYKDYQSKKETWNEAIRQLKEKEIQELQQRIQTFQQTAQQSLQTKESELLKPLLDKAEKAIKDVAKEGKYTYVFNVSEDAGLQNMVLYYSEESEDITPLVKKKLGITK